MLAKDWQLHLLEKLSGGPPATQVLTIATTTPQICNEKPQGCIYREESSLAAAVRTKVREDSEEALCNLCYVEYLVIQEVLPLHKERFRKCMLFKGAYKKCTLGTFVHNMLQEMKLVNYCVVMLLALPVH